MGIVFEKKKKINTITISFFLKTLLIWYWQQQQRIQAYIYFLSRVQCAILIPTKKNSTTLKQINFTPIVPRRKYRSLIKGSKKGKIISSGFSILRLSFIQQFYSGSFNRAIKKHKRKIHYRGFYVGEISEFLKVHVCVSQASLETLGTTRRVY